MASDIRCKHKTDEDGVVYKESSDNEGNQYVECFVGERCVWDMECSADGYFQWGGAINSATLEKFDAYRKHFNETGRLYDEPPQLRVGVFATGTFGIPMVCIERNDGSFAYMSRDKHIDGAASTLDELCRSCGTFSENITWLSPQRDNSEAVRMVGFCMDTLDDVTGLSEEDSDSIQAVFEKLSELAGILNATPPPVDAVREAKREFAEWLLRLRKKYILSESLMHEVVLKYRELTGDES